MLQPELRQAEIRYDMKVQGCGFAREAESNEKMAILVIGGADKDVIPSPPQILACLMSLQKI